MPGGDLWNSDGNHIAIWGFDVAAGVPGAAAAANAEQRFTTVDRCIFLYIAMVRDTTDVAAIVTDRIGKEEARSNPGFFLC